MGQITEKTIDIDSILKNKMGNKSKWVPRQLVSWLKRIAHQDQVNAFLWESRDKVGTPWLEACVDYLKMTLVVEGEENLPDPNDGRLYTFVSNHPLGGEDGVALGALIGRHYDSHFRYLVNDLLMYLPGLAPLCIPINKTGKASRNFPAMVEAGFQSDNHMLMFPAGLCSRKQKGGIIRDLEWKPTVIKKAQRYQRDIIPFFFDALNRPRFYRIARLRKRLGFKFNFEMALLPAEMFAQRGKKMRIVFGRPIPYTTFDQRHTAAEWAALLREHVYKLKDNPLTAFNPA